MATFAHTETGAALDPQTNATADEYLARYNSEATAKWTVVQVPDGTQHGAKGNGDGTYTNPPAPLAPPKPEFMTLSGSDFIALVGGVLGFARLDQLLAKSKTIEALLLKAEKIDRLVGNTPNAIAFLMTGTNALMQAELDGIDAAWRAKTNLGN